MRRQSVILVREVSVECKGQKPDCRVSREELVERRSRVLEVKDRREIER